MAVTFTFDGANKLIIVNDGPTHDWDAQEVYSRWKEWVLTDDNSKYVEAFRSVAGDPISNTQNISPYIFLNNTAGWRIRCHESDHEMHVTGNLYGEDPDLPLFTPTLGDFTVVVTIDRSAASITTTVTSGSGLSTDQSTMLLEMYKLLGLDPTKPLVVTPTTRKVPADGSDINEVGNDVTVQRV
jgi:hypothetical protein